VELVKNAPVVFLAHATATIDDTSQQLPGVDDAHAAGARGVILQDIETAPNSPLWLTLDDSAAAEYTGIKLEPSVICWFVTDDVRKAHVAAPTGTANRLSVTYFR
jgi:hypothetical protein